MKTMITTAMLVALVLTGGVGLSHDQKKYSDTSGAHGAWTDIPNTHQRGWGSTTSLYKITNNDDKCATSKNDGHLHYCDKSHKNGGDGFVMGTICICHSPNLGT